MPDSMRSILLVDPDRTAREGLAVMLRKKIECVVLEAPNPVEALNILGKEEVSLLITDLLLPRKEGLELLRKAQEISPETATIVSVPYGDRDSLVEVLKAGAVLYINSPYDFDEAVIATARGLAHQEMLQQRERRAPAIRKSEGFHGIIGQSQPMQKLFGLIEKVADDLNSTVLIQGESGTGKELVARAIHAYSPRKGKNFVPVNCAAIPEDLLESELFGYVKGAFTGANQTKMGRIQYADGGALFLDEIGDMKPSLQAKLLRVLQEKEFEPVSVDVRIIAATHRNLEQAVIDGTFREDLYYRLSVIPLNIPPLRQRREDIPVLIERFVRAFNRGKRHPLVGFSPEAMQHLLAYPWPGNVRELENLAQRMVILLGGSAVAAQDLPEKYLQAGIPVALAVEPPVLAEPAVPEMLGDGGIDFNALVSDFEGRLILEALAKAGGNKKEAAKMLNLKRTTLIEKIKKKQLEDA
ncbi:MAG: sigma-54-dependent transcriptional regulator [Trichloromonadaceae bacterium]